MRKLIVALALLAVMSVPVLGQTEQNLGVEVQVAEYAELTVIDGQIVLDLDDATDVHSGLNDGSEGQAAHLQLQANYTTDVVVTSENLMEVDGGYTMALTSDNGSELGVWPQGAVNGDAGQNWISWDEAAEQVVINDSSGAGDVSLNSSSNGTGNGIVPGIHDIYVGVSSNIGNTDDGMWTDPGTYTGTVTATVQAHN